MTNPSIARRELRISASGVNPNFMVTSPLGLVISDSEAVSILQMIPKKKLPVITYEMNPATIPIIA
jgi:hypothetical protein